LKWFLAGYMAKRPQKSIWGLFDALPRGAVASALGRFFYKIAFFCCDFKGMAPIFVSGAFALQAHCLW
jgi:hypothetical protein